MPTPQRKHRLLEAYTFPGFRPLARIRGLFGDPKALLLRLVRRPKKRPAAARVAKVGSVGMTDDVGARAIWAVPIGGYISSLNFAASIAVTVVP